MMDTEEYNKILQLVKSDDINNRLLGFQLAKGQEYDLVELLKSVKEDIGAYGSGYTIGRYSVYWYFSNNRKGWQLRTTIDNYGKHATFLTNDIIAKDPLALEDTIMNFKKLFINLITE